VTIRIGHGKSRLAACAIAFACHSPVYASIDDSVMTPAVEARAAPTSPHGCIAAASSCTGWKLGDATEPTSPSFASASAPPADTAPAYGPPAELPHSAADDAPNPQRVSFGQEIGAVKWEVGAIFAYMTITQAIVTKETQPFHFQDEGWFGKDTKALGMDKLTHAFNTYMFADFLQHRIEKRTGSKGAIAAAVLASGLQLYSELWDAHKVTSGFSVQDVAFNTLGGAFSVLRNTTPGLRDKLDFRLMIVPNSSFYTFKGSRHYAQQRYLFALTLAGFDGLKDTPLRFVELHAGYYGKGFTARDKALGREPQRKLFFGIGLNVKELFFHKPRSNVARMAGSTLDYLQLPYTAVHVVP